MSSVEHNIMDVINFNDILTQAHLTNEKVKSFDMCIFDLENDAERYYTMCILDDKITKIIKFKGQPKDVIMESGGGCDTKKETEENKKISTSIIDLERNCVFFDATKIQTECDNEGKIWTNAFTIAKLLGYKNVTKAIENNVEKKYIKLYQENQVFINYQGLLFLVNKCKTKECKEFKLWTIEKLIPEIVKYETLIKKPDTQRDIMKKLKEDKIALKKIKKELKYKSSKLKYKCSKMKKNVTKCNKNKIDMYKKIVNENS